ncbi:MAG TPA: hypothetical protein VNO82_21165 [Solirubrobacteraceae bacterium]|nr:hypothetical protein [Solirubrobacteraceae bacterium]
MTFPRAAAAALLAVLVLAAPAGAGPLSPGQVDQTFSGDGVLRSGFGLGWDLTADRVLPLRGGRIAVLTNARRVLRLRGGGGLDRSFGRRGIARLTGLETASAIAEAPGRAIVVAGRRQADILRVRKLRPDGQVDRSFRLASFETRSFLSAPDVDIAPDGTALVAVTSTVPYSGAPPRVLVYALGSDGRLVQGFGDGSGVGLVQLDRYGYAVGGLLRLPDGRLRYVLNAGSGRRVLLAGFTADGRPDTALGPAGVRVLSTPIGGRVSGTAVNATGRILLMATRYSGRIVVQALTADGARDLAYGDDGFARVPLPFGASAGGIAVLGDGRTAVSVTRRGRPRRPAVVMLGRRGRQDRRFGIGVVGSGFPRNRAAYLDQLAVDRLDRLVLGGLSGDGVSDIREDFGRDYLAMARMRTRRPALGISSRAAVTAAGEMRLLVRCRAPRTCQASLRARRGRARGRVSIRVRSGRERLVGIPLGAFGARHAARGLTIRVSAVIAGGPRIEPVALRVRLRRG